MRRLGVRKIVTAAFNSKVGQGTDKLINSLVVLPGTLSNTLGITDAASKIKIDVSGKRNRSRANVSIQEKIEMANRKLVEQDARDITAAKEFEREESQGIKDLGFSVDLELVATTRLEK